MVRKKKTETNSKKTDKTEQFCLMEYINSLDENIYFKNMLKRHINTNKIILEDKNSADKFIREYKNQTIEV